MAGYHVYGIGNALLDMVYEVDEDFLRESGIDKGLMTLIDENRQNELLEMVGNLSTLKSCGGSAANTMIAVAQMGGRSFYSCKAGDDAEGKFYYEDMQKNGVDSNLKDGLMDGVTGKCIVFITPDADRTMNTYLGITENFSTNELREEKIKQAKYIYVEGYLVTSDTGRAAAIEAVQLAKKHGARISMTFSDPAMVKYFKDGINEIMGGKIDLLFCNEDEAKSYTGCGDISDAAEKLKEVASTFAITLGAQGAIVFDGSSMNSVPGKKVKAIDTNGAGDLFAGSFLYAITHGHDFVKAANLACAASARLVTVGGARLTKDQVVEIKKDVIGE
ncbi:MAG: adenosine kinase [Bacteriovoracaceae bacterium]|nr:adenosine kinase [Bacteriovoracaceae bacterium]